jgi:Tol biopolymer transport system component
VMIVPPAYVTYRGITFSNDGNFVYYVIFDDNNPNGTLFEIPVLGGTPRKIFSDLATPVAFSPDGKKLTFVRQYHAVGEEALIISNADGSAERKLAVCQGDDFFISGSVAPSWSPDGRMIAISVASNKGVQHVNIIGYAVADGSQKLLSAENWKQIERVTWFSDGRGLAFVGKKGGSTNSQLWYLQYPEGMVRTITNDLSSYDGASVGVTSDATTIVTANFEVRSNIWILGKSESAQEPWDAQHAVQITSGAATQDGVSGIDWTPNHKIVYSSLSGGTSSLWIMDSDGTNQHQLTLGSQREYYPNVSTDGKFIAYVSDKDTTPHIWRMDIDGGNPTRLSFAEDYYPSITPDGKFVVYAGWATGKTLLYKIPLAGGDSLNLSVNPVVDPKVSPDGKLIVCGYYDEIKRKWGNAILILDGALLQRSFTLPYSASNDTHEWDPDGKSISYIDTRNGVSNIWSLPTNGGEPKQVTNFTSGLIFQYKWSKDGKYLTVARGQVTTDVVLITENK